MAIPHATVLQLSHEGIDAVSDLSEFDMSSLKQIADNLRRPGGRVADPSPGAGAGATIPTPAFVFGAKSQMRIEVACNLIRFYDTIGRPLTATNLKWTVMYKFGLIWKSLVARQLKAHPETPKISLELTIMKWLEAFEDHLHCCIGVRMIPLSYVIRENANVACAPPLATDEPFSGEWGSVQVDLIVRVLHTYALYNECNHVVYFKLEEACRGTKYADSLNSYKKLNDGCGGWLALKR
jgi:hypothetical protein